MAGDSQSSKLLPAFPRSSLKDNHQQSSVVPCDDALGASRTNSLYSWRALVIATAAFIPVLVPAILLGCLVYFPTQRQRNPEWFTSGCDPLGNVWISHNWDRRGESWTPSVWNVKYALTINVGFGYMPFSHAKGIDVAWDFFVGRGSQFLCTVALYYIFRAPIAEAFQQSPKAYDVVLAMQYSPVSVRSLVSFTEYARRLARKRTRECVGIALLVISTTYVLLLPTLLSAMSGYQAEAHPVLPVDNNTYVGFHELKEQCDLIIADGSRIGLNDNYCIHSKLPTKSDFYQYYYWINSCGHSQRKSVNGTAGIKWCDTASNFTYSGRTFNLDAPSLHYIYQPFDGSWKDYMVDPPLVNYQDHGYTVDYLRDYGQCQQTQSYQWGFSFLIAFSTLVWTLILFTTLYAYWIWSRTRYNAIHTKAVFAGKYQTAVAVAEKIAQDTEDVDAKVDSFAKTRRSKNMEVASTPLAHRDRY